MANPCAHSLLVFPKCHPYFLCPSVISHFSSLAHALLYFPLSTIFPPAWGSPICSLQWQMSQEGLRTLRASEHGRGAGISWHEESSRGPEILDTLCSSCTPHIISHLFLLLQCAGKELKAVVDTGSQHNLMSSACLDRLG